ncbi:hypothetical protein GCM10010211_25430 [Streptomyces albospinus]|uniref:Secreted protein n=1 Tax=Streptomyces albospinus TaxID=285515 RepID=A0ABQ2UYE6_9ACTN|nr:DUF6344 domain-containing protein [Streptomyces albospinus]GGU59430.1 hypothetical protein GCM10010211_25430 [Streptomyces albospinus]
MAATKVMKFWAACLAVLGKLLASLGVSAAASAARRDAAIYERTLGSTDPGPATPKAVTGNEPDHDPAVTPAAEPVRPLVPAARTAPRYGQSGSVRLMHPLPSLPPTIKQRIGAEAHGSSPTSRTARTRVFAGSAPLYSAPADAALHGGSAPVTPLIPAARDRSHNARAV